MYMSTKLRQCPPKFVNMCQNPLLVGGRDVQTLTQTCSVYPFRCIQGQLLVRANIILWDLSNAPREMRAAIFDGTFADYANAFLATYQPVGGQKGERIPTG